MYSLEGKKQTCYGVGRKVGVNVLSDDTYLQFHFFAFRSGWTVKNMHSDFDYIFNSVRKDMSCAKVLSGWKTIRNGEYNGGIPPTPDDIKTESDKVTTFIHFLFFNQNNIDWEVHKLLTGTLLHWYQDFQNILDQDPNQKYTIKRNYIAIDKIEQAQEQTQVSSSTFILWQKEIK